AMAIPYLAAGPMENGRITLIVRETNEKISVAPRMVVNASGAWVDRVQGNLGFTDRMIGGTKGAHLIMRHAELAKQLGDTMLYFETDDHRSCLIYKMDSDLLMLGTTDLRNDNPDDKTTTEAEIDYLFGVLRPILPKVRFTRQDIVFAYAGVRPLPLSTDSATGAISRDHKLVRYPVAPGRPFPMVTLVGGKWTTYRVVGEQIAAEVLQFLGKERRVDTKVLAIGGGNGYPALGAARDEWLGSMARRHRLSRERCRLLATRYGANADGFAAAEAASADRFAHLKDYTPAEIDLITRTERVTHLEDVVLRRTLMAFEGAVSVGSLDEVSKVLAAALGWDETSRLAEVEACARLLRERHRMVIA
ncbi:MAG: FAD-dependent oxidoreductase, partial [Paracoccaceae bacterium]